MASVGYIYARTNVEITNALEITQVGTANNGLLVALSRCARLFSQDKQGQHTASQHGA